MATIQENTDISTAGGDTQQRNDQAETLGTDEVNATTKFTTETTVQSATSSGSPYTSTLVPVRDQTVADFMKRPLMLFNTLWNVGQVSLSQLYSTPVSAPLGFNTMWFEKHRGFENIRGTAVFRIVVNANPFQQGMLVGCFVPIATATSFTSELNGRLSSLSSISQLPRVFIDARDGVGIMKIPYLTPFDFYNKSQGLYDWGTFSLRVFQPLQVGSGGTTNVSVSIYLHFEDFEMASPMRPQMMTTKAKKTRVVVHKGAVAAEQHAASGGPLTEILSAVSGAASLVSTIVPSLSPIAGPAAWVSRFASNVASMYGWSKPQSTQQPNKVVQSNAAYFSNSDGVSNAHNLGLISDNGISVMQDFAGVSEDEMSLSYIAGHESYYRAFGWSTADLAGVTLYNEDIKPSSFGETSLMIGSGFTQTFVKYAPFAFLARYFAYWRGSVTLRFKMVKTEYHTGRLQLTFTPSRLFTTSPDLNTSSFSIRQIVDIDGISEFQVTLPYLLPQKYIPVTESIGRFEIVVLNTLRAPETCANNVVTFGFAKGGPDFELEVPATSLSSVPFAPQVGVGIHTEEKENPGVLASYDPSPQQMETSSLCIGERFTSIKQLISRYSILRSNASTASTAAGASAGTVEMYPYTFTVPTANKTTGASIDCVFSGDALSYFSTGYAFFRGSVKVAVYNPDNVTTPTFTALKCNPASITDFHFVANQNSLSGFNSASPPVIGSDAYSAISGMSIHNSNTGVVEVKVPYHCVSHMSYLSATQRQSAGLSASLDPCQPVGRLLISTPGSTKFNTLFRSASDEFQFGYFLGFAPIWLSTV